MKTISNLLLAGMTAVCSAQTIPSLPVPIGAGSIEVWNDSLYFFGGSNTWGGRNQLYSRVYKFDGTAWSYQDSIPDNNVWGIESVLAGNQAYLLGGWRSGASLLRKYDLSDGTWTYLTPSPNTASWGITAEYLNGFIYLFNASGNVFEYDVANNIWHAKTSNTTVGYSALRSVAFQDEIYIIGFYNSGFYKYNPATDKWTTLANTPYPVAGCAMGIINGLIYCAGGSEQGSNADVHQTIMAYDIGANSWVVDRFQINSGRTWMAATEYQGGFYVIGGFDSLGAALNAIEKIEPLGPISHVNAPEQVPVAFALSQNYPNPFWSGATSRAVADAAPRGAGNPSTVISYQLPTSSETRLEIYNLSGQRVRTLVSGTRPAGRHQAVWDGRDDGGRAIAGGTYFYRLKSGGLVQQRKLTLVK